MRRLHEDHRNYHRQPLTYALDILEEEGEAGEERCVRNGNVGVFFGIGKLFYEVFDADR